MRTYGRWRHHRTLETQEVPLYGDSVAFGYYYAEVYIGTPPSRHSVIVDTGSATTAMPCSGCSTCGKHQDPAFDIKGSSTSSPVLCKDYGCSMCSSGHCSYRVSYTEGSSIAGVFVKDKLWLGSDDASVWATTQEEEKFGVDYIFGCHQSEGGLFKTQAADGIMGLGPYENRPGSIIVDTLKLHGKIDKKVFTMCLHKTGGMMAVGKIDTRFHTSPIAYVPKYGSAHWGVDLKKVVFGGKALHASRWNNCIVDSGTTFTYLPTSAHNDFETQLRDHCSKTSNCPNAIRKSVRNEGMCYEILYDPEISLATFPTISFHLDGYVLEIPGSQYMFNSEGKIYCAGFYNNGYSGTVIGGNAMQRHDVVFDGDNRRIGFATADCNPEKLASEPPTTAGPTATPPTTAEPTEAPPTTAEPTEAPPTTAEPTEAPSTRTTPVTTNAPTATQSGDDNSTGSMTRKPTIEPTANPSDEVVPNTKTPTLNKATSKPSAQDSSKENELSLIEKLLSKDKGSVAIIFASLGSFSTALIFTVAYFAYNSICRRGRSTKYARLGKSETSFEEGGVRMVTI